MKNKILLVLQVAIAVSTHSQNTFPATGNVGIGTTTPGIYYLAIQGTNSDGGATSAPSILVKNTNTTASGGSVYNFAWASYMAGNGAVLGQTVAVYGTGVSAPWSSGSGYYILTRTDNPIIFGTGATTAERMRLTNTGNLGIGTTNPAGNLSFQDVNATTVTNGITWYSATGDPTLYGIHKTAGAWSAPNYQQIRIGWQTGIILDPGTAYGASYVNVVGNGLRVTNGTVGIGTLSTNDPNYKLFVETGIRTRKIKVDQAAWPDYVFDPAYYRLSLTDLEKFIHQNHHLPNIASEEEVKKEGIDLGANQSKLLEKIEELTLYIIDQNKKLDDQQKAIDRLKEDIEVLKKSIKN